MPALIWGGTALTLVGLVGLVTCIVSVFRARGAGLDESTLKARLQKVVAWNLAALLTSALGLAAVVVGILLG